MEHGGNINVAINGAVVKLDLERAQAPAVTDRRQSGGIHRFARDAGNDRTDGWVGRIEGVETKLRRREEDAPKLSHSVSLASRRVRSRARARGIHSKAGPPAA